VKEKGKLRKQPSMGENVDVRLILPGGSLVSTLDDIAVFGQMHLNDGVYNGRRVLSKASVTEMRRLQSPDPKPEKTYGLCWYRDDISEAGLANAVFHGGAFGALLRVDRRNETVTVFLVHSEFNQVKQIHDKLNQQVEQIFPVANR